MQVAGPGEAARSKLDSLAREMAEIDIGQRKTRVLE